jgi:hypothetical protein
MGDIIAAPHAPRKRDPPEKILQVRPLQTCDWRG